MNFLKHGCLTNKLMHFEEGLGNSTYEYYSLTDPLLSRFNQVYVVNMSKSSSSVSEELWITDTTVFLNRRYN